MGGIKMATMGIECDRCKKVVTVDDPKATDFYAKFSEREQKAETMFAAVFTSSVDGGEKTDEVIFEYLCPACCKAVAGYLFKSIRMQKEPEAKKERKPRKPKPAPVAPATATAPAAPAPEPPAAAPPTAPTPAPVVAAATAKPGNDFNDDDLFN